MKTSARRSSVRRRPRQRRALETVEAILDSVTRVLKREGAEAITTNRIAEVAGVSIGSVYQYFPDKRAILVALHERHIAEVDRMIESKLVENAAASLEGLVRALIEAMIDAHAIDPELHELLMTHVPHKADGSRDFASRLHGAFRLAISSRTTKPRIRRDIDEIVFVVANMVDALSHAAVLRRPSNVSLSAAKEEAVRAVMAYLRV